MKILSILLEQNDREKLQKQATAKQWSLGKLIRNIIKTHLKGAKK